MSHNAKKDRRSERSRRFRIQRSAFLQVPASISGFVLAVLTLLTVTVDYLNSRELWLGPVYLIIIAAASWLVSGAYATVVGLFVLSFNLLTYNENTYPFGQDSLFTSIALNFFCVVIVVLMLSLARKSLDKEWRLARTDPLTGALNRQAFFEAIRAEADCQKPAILAFADVDGLKNLNDVKGHELGDEGLRNFARRFKAGIRKSDMFARLGGDEFVAFMRVKDEAAARLVANRLNKTLNCDVETGGTTLKCSLGVLFLPTGSKAIDAELRLADKLMYSAKRINAGFLMASSIQVESQAYLSPALEMLLPENHKSIVRQENTKEAARNENEIARSDIAPAKAKA